MFFLVKQDCPYLNASVGDHIGLSENSINETEIQDLIRKGVLIELTEQESKQIYLEQSKTTI